MNETNDRQANFHLGGNDDDLSNDSQPRTSPTSKPTGENDPLKRVSKSHVLILFLRHTISVSKRIRVYRN